MLEIRHITAALRYPLLWAAILLSLALAALAYQLPLNHRLDMGAAASSPYLENFYPPQYIEGRAARWSHAYSYIRLPGTGGNRSFRITVEFNPSRRGAEEPQPVHITGLVAQDVLYDMTLQPDTGWQTLVMDVDTSHSSAFSARDLAIELRTDVYRPPDYQGNELGILVSGVSVEPLPGAAWSPVMPNVRVMLLVGALLLGLYLLLYRAWSVGKGLTGAVRLSLSDSRFAAALAALAGGVVLAVALAVNVVALSVALPSIVVYVLVGYLLLLAGVYLLPGILPAFIEEVRAVRRALKYGPLFVLVLIAPVVFSLGFQPALRYTIDLGSGRDTPFITGFNPPMFPLPDGSPGDYRYTSARSSVTLAGAGSDNFYDVTLRMNPGDGPASRAEIRILANGTQVAALRLAEGWQDVPLRVSTGQAQVFGAANLVLEVVAPAQVVEGGEQRGVMVERVTFEQVGGEGVFSRSPAHEAGLLLGTVLLYLLITRLGGLSPLVQTRRLALLATACAATAAGWALFAQRVEVAVALPHLLITLASGYLLLVLAGRLLPRLFHGAGQSARVLQAALVLAFILRFGISALPQMRVIDLPYHLGWLRTLIGGDFLALYLPGELSQVPPEWSLDVLIPKSPLFYVAMWPLGLLQGLDLGAMLLFAVSLLDAGMVLAVFALVRRVSPMGGMWAALLYAVMPLAFRAFAFGILPTIFAQALTLLAMLPPLLAPERLRRPLPFAGWVLLLAASLIAFPTALAFNSLVLVVLALGWGLRRDAPAGTALAILAGLGAALVLSVILYYGLYIEALFTRTLPALTAGVTLGGEELWPGGPAELVGWTAGYVVNWLPWLLVPMAILLIWQTARGVSKRLAVLLLAWLVVLLMGMLLNLRFDMIGKHLYYTMPAACIGAGLIFAGLWRRCAGAYGRTLVSLAAVSVVWSALAFVASRF